MTLTEIVAGIERAELDIARAPYMSSLTAGDRIRVEGEARRATLRKTMIKHDGSTRCPVLPATRVMIRHEPHGALVSSGYPERLNWTLVSEWRPIWL